MLTPYKMAYGLMPSKAASSADARQMYINGHFCYGDKSIGDSSALKPVLQDFFFFHPTFHPDIFLGDSAFDTIEIHSMLKDDFFFS